MHHEKPSAGYYIYPCDIAGKTVLASKNRMDSGGGRRNRTGVHGFAGRCMTTLPPRRRRAIKK